MKDAQFIASVRKLLAEYDRKVIGFVGDSHLAVPAWTTLLGIDTDNQAVSGARLSEILLQVDQLADGIGLCFVMGGKNDIDAGRTSAQIAADQLAVCAKLKARGITPVLMTMFYVSSFYPNGSYINSVVNPVANHTYRPCIDAGYVWLNVVDSVCADNVLLPQYTSDGCHLNAAGIDRILPPMRSVLNST